MGGRVVMGVSAVVEVMLGGRLGCERAACVNWEACRVCSIAVVTNPKPEVGDGASADTNKPHALNNIAINKKAGARNPYFFILKYFHSYLVTSY